MNQYELDEKKLLNLASINGHSYSTLNNMGIGPVPSSDSSPGLPLTLENNSCAPTPNPSVTTSSNAGDVEDGSPTTQQTATNLNNNSSRLHNNNLNSHHSIHSQQQQQLHHQHHHHQQQHHLHHQQQHQPQHQQQEHHHHQQHSAESPNDQSPLIILQPSGVGVTSEIGSGSVTGIGGYSSMLPSFGHYATGKS